jgi:hypothetical protein
LISITQTQSNWCKVVAAGGWSKYKGQILHLNSDFSELYSLSDVDSVIYDADSEFQALFKKYWIKKRFFLVLNL